jgi:lipopolysaccharide export system permease protein
MALFYFEKRGKRHQEALAKSFNFAKQNRQALKKLNWFILKSYVGPLVMTFFIALFILLMQFLWRYIDDLVGKGLEINIIAQLLFYASFTFVPMAFPISILLSSIMTFGNFGEHYELVAMKASGISTWKVMRPLVILSVFISLFAFYFSNNMLPIANLKFKTTLYDVQKKKLAFDISEGIFYDGIESYVIRINSKGRDGQTIYDVKIYDHTDNMGNIKVITAEKGFMELSPNQQNIIFTLYDGYSYTDVYNVRNYRNDVPFERTKFKEQRLKFDLSEFNMSRSQEDLFKGNYMMLNISQLNYYIDSIGAQIETKKEQYSRNFTRRLSNYASIDTTKAATAIASIKQRDTAQQAEATDQLRWPLINSFIRADQIKIIENALQATRNTRENVIWTKKDFQKREETLKKHQVFWHKKFSLSIACFILFFIGAPMGAIVRKGGLGLPLVIAVGFFLIYYLTSIFGEKAAQVGDLNVYLGVWLSSIVLFPIGLFLTFKATTDAPLLDGDNWKRLFIRMYRFFNKEKTATS